MQSSRVMGREASVWLPVPHRAWLTCSAGTGDRKTVDGAGSAVSRGGQAPELSGVMGFSPHQDRRHRSGVPQSPPFPRSGLGAITSVGREPRVERKVEPEGAVSTQEKHKAALQRRLSGSGHNTSEKTLRIFEGSDQSKQSNVRESFVGSSGGRGAGALRASRQKATRPRMGRLLLRPVRPRSSRTRLRRLTRPRPSP